MSEINSDFFHFISIYLVIIKPIHSNIMIPAIMKLKMHIDFFSLLYISIAFQIAIIMRRMHAATIEIVVDIILNIPKATNTIEMIHAMVLISTNFLLFPLFSDITFSDLPYI